MKEISTKKQSNNITKKTVNIRESETTIQRIHISTNNDSTVLTVPYKQQQYNIESSKTTTIDSEKYSNSDQINKEQINGTENIYEMRFNKGKRDTTKHISKSLACTIQENKSITENKKINNKFNRLYVKKGNNGCK